MKIITTNSLATTLDKLNETFFYDRSLAKSQKKQAAKWIAIRQGLPGAYANMFAPTKIDFKKGIRLFTGERVDSMAAIGHILGEESCRTLILLGVSDREVKNALKNASLGMMHRLNESLKGGGSLGRYCCGTCSVSLWRHLAVGGLKGAEARLATGLEVLKSHRDGLGRWKSFPFFYTLLALSDIDLPSAIKEIKYTAKVCERYLGRAKKKDKITQRRRHLAEKILGKL